MNHTTEFLEYIQFEKRCSAHTLTSYKCDLDQFFEFVNKDLQVEEISQVNSKDIRGWVVFLMEKNISPRSVNRKLATLRTYYKFLLREKLVEINPLDKVIAPKTSKNLPEFVEDIKMSRLLDDIEFKNNFEGVRDKLILEMFYSTGMRLSELVGLKMKDVDLYTNNVKVLGKRNKERLIPFTKELRKSIDKYILYRLDEFPDTEEETFFLTNKGDKCYQKFVYRIVNYYLSKVTTQSKRSPHILRHTFATHMLNAGADLNAIKEILGHANLSATQIYTHNNFEKLNKVYEQAHPRA